MTKQIFAYNLISSQGGRVIALNSRLCELLNNCVEEYIKFATPVASQTLAEKSAVSAATIRNDLKTLEQMGYLHQVHTSGGRVPTRAGFANYIDADNTASFAGDLINDLYELTRLVDRIDRKIHGSGAFPIRAWNHDQVLERRQNIYRLLELPDLDISAFYLIIKERLDGRK